MTGQDQSGGEMDTITEIPLCEISGDNYRPEDADHVRDLASKIDREGFRSDLYGAVTVTLRPDGGYSLESGFHRVAACRLIGRETVPCVVVDAGTEADRLIAQLDGNAHRLDAPAWAEAEAFGELVALGETPATIADKLGRSEAYVLRRLAMLNLDPAVRRMGLGFVWTDALADLPWHVQRDLVRKLSESPMNRDAWSALCQRARDSITEQSSFLELTAEEWSTELDGWARDVADQAESVVPCRVSRELVLGLAEVAEYLGIQRTTLYKRVQRGQMPPADLEVSRQDAWYLSTIDAWVAEQSR